MAEVRYVALARRPVRACDDDFYPDATQTMNVIEEDCGPTDTGLLDANGVRIYRMTERAPIGFCR